MTDIQTRWPRSSAEWRERLVDLVPWSDPVYTTEASDSMLTVIRVVADGLVSHQVYAVADHTWELIAVHGLFVDALLAVRDFKTYLAGGATIADWRAAHPHGIAPSQPLFTIERTP